MMCEGHVLIVLLSDLPLAASSLYPSQAAQTPCRSICAQERARLTYRPTKEAQLRFGGYETGAIKADLAGVYK